MERNLVSIESARPSGKSSIRLNDHKAEVMRVWTARCLKEVPSAGSAVPLVLKNSIPIYLTHLIEALATNKKMDFKSVFARDEEGTRISKKHGADRAANPSYLLTEVIFEYHLLREVIFEVLESDGSLNSAQRDIVLDSIEQAVNDAAVEFSEIQTDIQKKFVNILTHDLKTPITSAKISAELILRREDMPLPAIDSSKRIIRSMNRIESMIQDLLDGSRVRAGEQLDLQFVECDLEEMIVEVVADMVLVYGDRFTLESKEKLIGIWARDGIRRTIENLLNNAVKYSTPGSPIVIKILKNPHMVQLEVHNEGNPISPADIPLLFKQFRRGASARKGVQTGWGLGLTLVKGVIDACKGKVRVESSVSEGTSFIIEIPSKIQ